MLLCLRLRRIHDLRTKKRFFLASKRFPLHGQVVSGSVIAVIKNITTEYCVSTIA